MVRPMEKTERDLVDDTQSLLADAKRDLSSIARNMKELARVNRDAGRAEAANAAMRFEGEAKRALGQLIIAHADASDSMVREWPEDGMIVAFGGGGGR